ncbi:MAG: carboxy-S-adenosyl-L-methionine synthase CmoA [Calditrichaceae bacterium]|jgi:tRNA (cmo5U34)-methyltransferase
MKKDTIYQNPKNPLGDFKFDEEVTKVFPDMLQRSIPGYNLILSMINMYTGLYAENNRNYYDLGCSLGAATLSMGKALKKDHGRIISVDNSKAMIKKSRQNIERANLRIPVDLICEDLQNIKITNARIVVMNFTLQFVPKNDRETILKRIYNGMVKGAVLILSEKTTFSDLDEKDFNESLYVEFKKSNGYSNLEISQKRTALEKILVPDTTEEHIERLKQCGYIRSNVWYRCLNFASMVAFK